MKETKAEKKARQKAERQAKAEAKRRGGRTSAPSVTAPAQLPASPHALEEVQQAEPELSEVFHFPMGRKVYKQNGVPFIYAMPEETYRILAEENNIILRQLLRYNDLDAERTLTPGTMVYLQAKKNQTRKGLDKYIVEQDGEQLRDICQRFGVKMKSISKLNGFPSSHRLREGDTILLRK